MPEIKYTIDEWTQARVKLIRPHFTVSEIPTDFWSRNGFRMETADFAEAKTEYDRLVAAAAENNSYYIYFSESLEVEYRFHEFGCLYFGRRNHGVWISDECDKNRPDLREYFAREYEGGEIHMPR